MTVKYFAHGYAKSGGASFLGGRTEARIVVVTAYHGTTLENASTILESHFVTGRKKWDWLGEVCIFAGCPSSCLEWANGWPGRKEKALFPQPAVIEAKLTLKDCLDLLDNDWNELLTKGLVSSQIDSPRRQEDSH